MKKLISHPLPYAKNVAQLFDHFAHLPYAIWLDSGYPAFEDQRYDIIVALPCDIISTPANSSEKEPFTQVKRYLNSWGQGLEAAASPYPFTVGAVGYVSYDAGQTLEKLPSLTTHDIKLPWAVFGIYDWSIIVDHQKKETWLITAFPPTHPKFHTIKSLLNQRTPIKPPFFIKKPFTSDITKSCYAAAFNQLKKYIYEGDCYQTNLCQRFTAEYEGCEWQAYQWLREKNPAPYSAFIHLPQGKILSLSPERFLKVQQTFVETKPIKGTAARFKNRLNDIKSAEKLMKSEKDKAENLMIVDLLRNDLGKTCKPGSIRVPELFSLKSFPNVHHLESTIVGELENDQHALDALRHAFPGGSITGAPKIRAMEIIEELETHHRSVYCGSIGYVSVGGNMDTSIAIRTLICHQQKIHCYSGGGIVYDSVMETEYEETLIKVEKLIKLLFKLSQKNIKKESYATST